MQNIKKVLEMTGLLFAMAMLFSFIAWFLGYEGFIIIGHIEYPVWIDYIMCPILLCINLSLLTGFVLNLYSLKVLWFSIPMALMSGIVEPFFPISGFINGPMSTLVLIIAIISMKLGKKGLIRLSVIFSSTLLYQWILSLTTNIKILHNTPMYDVYRISISSIILMSLFYFIGGINYVLAKSISTTNNSERKYWKRCAKWLELVVFPGSIRDDGQSSSNSPPTQVDGIQINKFEVWVMRSVIAIIQILQWVFILWICNLDNYFIDALAMTTSFICHGMIINKRRHFKPVIICTLLATMIFYFSARFTISFQYSHFFPIIIGLVLTYTVYRISHQFDKAAKAKSKQDLERIRNIEKKMDDAWDKLDKLS